jgi:divalent metal cation (Fe/Co/Zn/Cd) transporter
MAVLDPQDIEAIANGVSGIIECHGVRTRGTADLVYVDLHCIVDPDMSTRAAHDLANQVEATVKKEIPSVVDVIVHIEPYDRP